MSDLHADALAVLRGWAPPSPEQARLRDRYVEHLAGHPDGMTRECLPDHLTVGALVVSADGTRVLLNLHRKARRWFHFGGHVEPGDPTLASVAARETTEESGLPALGLSDVPLHLSEHAVPFCSDRDDVHHLDVRYGAIAPVGAEHAVSEESLDVRWWPVDALPEGLEEEMHTLVALARDWARRQPSRSAADSPGGSSTSAAADQPSR